MGMAMGFGRSSEILLQPPRRNDRRRLKAERLPMSDYLDFYLSNGFLVERGVLDGDIVDSLAAEVLLRQGGSEIDGPSRYEHAFAEFDLLDKLRASPLLAVWSGLLGANIVAIVNRHNHITVDSGDSSKAARLHRDSLNWSRTYLTSMMLLAGSDHRAWPRIIPGSHLWSPRGPSNGGGYWLDQDERRTLTGQALAVPMGPGDVILMDPMLFHAAGCGSRSMPRIALTMAVRAADELAVGMPRHEQLVLGVESYQGQNWFSSGSR
jgi:hypothetical protein